MAPARKKGANKVKSANELRLGDLVLAKVKGFPAWPAKVWFFSLLFIISSSKFSFFLVCLIDCLWYSN